MSFIFYDTETTGTDVYFDQILQFAAIRTDADLNELDRFEIRCRLHQHLVPSPGAVRVTGVGVKIMTDETLPSHYEMIRQIRNKLLSWSPAIFAGYNSMKFDESLLRQALYQTLHAPYLTNTHGNCRADVMSLVQNISFLDNEALVIPVGDNGKISYKLDKLAPANDFDHSKAHDALGDVEATIHLCRLIRDKCPDAWSAFTRFSQKAAVLDYISSERAFVCIEHYYNKPYPFVMTVLGYDEKQSAVAFVLDLSADLAEMNTLDNKELLKRLKNSPKPVRKLKANTAPFLMGLEDVPDHIKSRLPSEDIVQANLDWLDANPDFISRLLKVYEETREDYEPAIHIEQRIYEGFLSSEDEKILEEFHLSPWEKRADILTRLTDERYKSLGLHLIYRERPDVLPQEVRDTLDTEYITRLFGTESGGEPWLTLPKALEQTNDLLAVAVADEAPILSELAEYLIMRIEKRTN